MSVSYTHLADPGEFLSGIEAMARELVQTHAAALDGKKDLFREEKDVYKRQYIGIEINAEYCALARARIGGTDT